MHSFKHLSVADWSLLRCSVSQQICSLRSFLTCTRPILADSIMRLLCFNTPVAFCPSFLTIINLFFPPCLLKLVKWKHLRRSAGNNVEGVSLLRNIWAHTSKWGAGDASVALSSWSRTKRPPTQACDWQRHDGKTASLRNIQQTQGLVVFWVFLFEWSETST